MQLQKTSVTLLPEPAIEIRNQLAFAFTCDPEDMLDIFEEISLQLGFQLIQRQTTYSTSVKKPPEKKGLMTFINCFGCWNLDGVTAVKISLSKHSQKGKLKESFIAEIKGLVGVNEQITAFLEVFNEKISKYGLSQPAPKVMLEEDHELPELFSQNQTPYYLEACSYHLINKLLLNDQYEINSAMRKMLEDFKGTFQNLQESVGLLPLPMKNAMQSTQQLSSIVSDLREQLQKLMNQLKYPKDLYAYLRISVENYIFSKVQHQLYSIYRIKNLATESQFQRKRLSIISKYTIQEIAYEVCLNQKFWSFDRTKKDQLLPFPQLKKSINFSTACRQFQKIVFTTSPRQKIKYCQLGYTQLKNHFFDYSHRKYQLSSMEDIIPVLIIVVLMLEIGELRSELDIMVDFISFDPNQMEAEKRLLINISESYNYVFRDWVVKK